METTSNTPTVSIVTVCYNAEQFIERTILSIEAQDYPAIEYIVVDGQSKDRTMEIVKQHSQSVSRYVSEPDKGIYDAMNKGLDMATGEYVWFINAGDEVASHDTISRMMRTLGNEPADVIYGHAMVTAIDGTEIGLRRLAPPEDLTWRSFQDGMLVSHQSFVARRDICPNYDLKYAYSADYAWCLDILRKSNRIVNSHQTLSRFLDGGFTKQHISEGLRERFHIMCRHFGTTSTILHHIPIAVRFFWFWLTKGWF